METSSPETSDPRPIGPTLSAQALQSKIVYTTTGILRFEELGLFPKRRTVPPNRVAWELDAVIAWMQACIDRRASSNPQAPRPIIDANDRFIDRHEVLRITSLTSACLRRWQLDGIFPPRLHIGPGRIAWLKREVDAWVLARLNAAQAS